MAEAGRALAKARRIAEQGPVEAPQTAYDMRVDAIYRDGTRNLGEDAQRLLQEMKGFVTLCEGIVRSGAAAPD